MLLAYFWSGASFAALLLAIAGGAGVDRFGPRRMLQVGLALLGLGFLISSQARFPGAWYVALVALNLAMAIGIWLPVYTLLNNWFQRRKATAIVAVLLGSSVARLLASPVDAKLVALGWADVGVVVAGLVAWAVIGPVSVFVRNSPIERGALGDRVEEPISSESVTRNPQLLASPQPDFTWWEAIRSRNYWLITGGQALFGSAAYSLYTVQLQLAAQRGLTISSGGLADGAGTAATTVAIRVGGLVGDRIPIRFATAGFLAVPTGGRRRPFIVRVPSDVIGWGGGNGVWRRCVAAVEHRHSGVLFWSAEFCDCHSDFGVAFDPFEQTRTRYCVGVVGLQCFGESAAVVGGHNCHRRVWMRSVDPGRSAQAVAIPTCGNCGGCRLMPWFGRIGSNPVESGRRQFYRWWLVAIGAVFLAVSGAFASQLVRELDVLSRGGGMFSFGLAGYILAIQARNGLSVVAGLGVDRFGPRRMVQVA